ncbi:MAG: PDZ domain-containing protein, partial [Erysipelotrichaceae bacterium]|nr:PDZ domain-containing protein [Erysipelotrichaceae bacterium]
QVTDRPTIGIYLQELTSDTQNYKAGLYITDTITGSGAEAAGLQPYDRIIAIDDNEVSSYADLSIYLRSKHVVDVISLKVIREGQELTFDVTLTGTLSNSTATHQEEQQQPEQEEEQQPQNPWRP